MSVPMRLLRKTISKLGTDRLANLTQTAMIEKAKAARSMEEMAEEREPGLFMDDEGSIVSALFH